MTEFIWTKEIPTRGGWYWVKAAEQSPLRWILPDAPRPIRLVDFGGAAPNVEVDIGNISYCGGGIQRVKDGMFLFAGPILYPASPA